MNGLTLTATFTLSDIFQPQVLQVLEIQIAFSHISSSLHAEMIFMAGHGPYN